MTDVDHKAAVLADLNGTTPFRETGYYFSLDLTGVPAVDIIVSAVNWAGKRGHHTEDWVALDLVDRIDVAAEVAAEQYRALESALGRVMAVHSPNGERSSMCPVCFVTTPCATIRAITETGNLQ